MAKAIVLLLSVLTLISSFNLVVSEELELGIEGTVLCDSCNIGVACPLSVPLAGAAVHLTCTDGKTKEVFKTDTKTDKRGKFTVMVDRHEFHDNIDCEFTATSPDEQCNKFDTRVNKKSINCIKFGGGGRGVCKSTPLLFQRNKIAVGCSQFIQEMTPEDYETLFKLQQYV